ncbi:hypothetical protein Hypma_003745 [Hypsizygus marmoreus]|uniref:Uncharacterized protein n=1 Tax=Hypsizygus marmoreus TaxID=39966 RepID=A0A369J3S0_HYPMA|nr:hypothetical protein Hypma_003745 [Hypsizygus marmoreus]
MEQLSTFHGAALEAGFAEAFSGSVFKLKTVYKHRAFFQKAKDLNLVDVFKAYSRHRDGTWSSMVKEVQKGNYIRATSPSDPVSTGSATGTNEPSPPPTMNEPSPPPTPEPDHDLSSEPGTMEDQLETDDEDSFITRIMKFEWFDRVEGTIESQSALATDDIEVAIRIEPTARGHFKEVKLVCPPYSCPIR